MNFDSAYLEMARARFMRKVSIDKSGCWLWLGAALPKGYGITHFCGERDYAHRIAVKMFLGKVLSEGQLVMHSCDVPACVNPEHLSIGTQADNMRDAAQKGRTRYVSDWRANKNPKAKLSPEIAAEIRTLVKSGAVRKDVAAKFDVTTALVGMIVRGQIWQ